MSTLFDDHSGAHFSACNKYRYKLWRVWNDDLPKAMCIGLNPSEARAIKNDPTISILIRMLTRLGYGGFYMMNLFAWVSSKPKDLLIVADPIGENDYYLKQVEALCKDVIVCWGNFKQARARIEIVLPNYPRALCFGKNANGTPWHPLGLMYNGTQGSSQLMPYVK